LCRDRQRGIGDSALDHSDVFAADATLKVLGKGYFLIPQKPLGSETIVTALLLLVE
jgi:hypothetical protein